MRTDGTLAISEGLLASKVSQEPPWAALTSADCGRRGGRRRGGRRRSASPGACRLPLSAARPRTRRLWRECTLGIEEPLPRRLESTAHVLHLGEDVRCPTSLGLTREQAAAQEALGDLRWLGLGGWVEGVAC